jgi:hypothetical protein
MPSITPIVSVFEYHDSAEYRYTQFLSGNTNPYDDVLQTEYYIGPKPAKKKESRLERFFKKLAQKLE